MLLLADDNSLDLGTMVMGLLGGLALFLFGMEQMTGALKIVAGSKMRGLLSRLTANRFKALFAGAFVTSVIQSSSVTTVLVVGFISAGLMTLSQSVGVILGANIGTTVTAQIVAFKVTKYALAFVTVGFALQFVTRSEKPRQYGAMIMGLGMIFFGMHLMSDGTRPLRTYEPFLQVMQRMDEPFMAILVAAAFTAIIQSSSATIGVVIVLASQSFITLEAGIALAFGANIGSCVTALLAAVGKPREAVRAAFVHVIFNVLGVLIWLGFIDQFATIVRGMSPSAVGLDETERLAAETPRQIANAHTIFNVVNALLFIWLVTPLARLTYRLVPDRPLVGPQPIQPKYLDEILLQTPDLALDRVRMELGRLGACALSMVRNARRAVLDGTRADLDDLRHQDNDVDRLHGAIITYLGQLSMENLESRQSTKLYDYMAAANYIENIGDMVETNLHEAGIERLKHRMSISPATRAALGSLFDRVAGTVADALEALDRDDAELARRVTDAKEELSRLAADLDRHLAGRLTAHEPGRLAAFRVESDIVENLKRIYYFAKRIAKLVGQQEPAAETTAITADEAAAGERGDLTSER
jgi:phosphate:Na+ symporter